MPPDVIARRKVSTVLERVTRRLEPGRLILLAFYGLAILIFLDAPILALAWSGKPFTGFVVEQTLVVSGVSGEGWIGRDVGLVHPQRVVQLGERSVDTPDELYEAISALPPGRYVEVRTELPDGMQRVYPFVRVGRFSLADQLRLFWLPYAVGLAYLAIGLWLY